MFGGRRRLVCWSFVGCLLGLSPKTIQANDGTSQREKERVAISGCSHLISSHFSLSLSFSSMVDVPVTCGSAIKIRHVDSNYYLHSAGMSLNSGSGQQVTTPNGFFFRWLVSP